jgi:hypothetical protein
MSHLKLSRKTRLALHQAQEVSNRSGWGRVVLVGSMLLRLQLTASAGGQHVTVCRQHVTSFTAHC